MSIEVFNNKKSSRKATSLTAAGFMTAEEARNSFNKAVNDLAAEEVKKALEQLATSIELGQRSLIFAFKYNASNEVIEAAVQMLRELHYKVTMSKYYSSVIHITLPTE